MKLRKLQYKDAPFMLEWMKDNKVNQFFRFDPEQVTMESVIDFIKGSQSIADSYHFAIVDENDNYLGTVSLKNVDIISNNGEFAITLRTCAQGRGAGRYATEQILSFAFKQLDLERVYLNVLSDNESAISFYKKIGFIYEGEFYHHIILRGKYRSLMWFRMMKSEYEKLF
jgi:RimJ/RimL family protein N-acetyltransferase